MDDDRPTSKHCPFCRHCHWGECEVNIQLEKMDRVIRYLINVYLVADEWEPDQRKEKIDSMYKRLME